MLAQLDLFYEPDAPGSKRRSLADKLGDSLSVKDFGAIGDGMADDTAAIQACYDYATPLGATVIWPHGKYRLTSTVRIGRSVASAWQAIIERSDGGKAHPEVFTDHYLIENHNWNASNLRPTVTHFEGALIIGDWLPATPEPIIEHNISYFHGAAAFTGRVIVTSMSEGIEDGDYKSFDGNATATNKLIGFAFAVYGFSDFAQAVFGFLGTGLTAWEPYGCHFRSMRADRCNVGFNFGLANAMSATELKAHYCNTGMIFDGDASTISFHTEQCRTDIHFLQGNYNRIGPCYLEDGVPATDGAGLFFMKLGTSSGTDRLLYNTFMGILTNNFRTGKTGWRIWGTKKSTWIGCSAAVGETVDSVSNGLLVDTDFAQDHCPNPRFTRFANGCQTAGRRNYPLGSKVIVAQIAFDYPFHDFGTIGAGATVTHALTIPDLTGKYAYNDYLIQFQPDSGGDGRINIVARLASATTITLSCTNPTAAGISQGVAGKILLTLLANE
jgi:hypothetical protein